MIGMVKSLRYEGHRAGIKVNAIMPGAATAMTSGAFGGKQSEAAEKMAREMERTMPPEHVTPITLFLCHESCPDSGEMIYAETGLYGRVDLFKTPPLKTPDRT